MNAILFVLAVVTYLCYVQGQTPCRSPSGAGGGCVAVTQCPALLTLVNKSSRTPAEMMLLRQAHCGYQGTLPMVCCAAENPPPPVDNACFTPDAKLGRCVGASSCAHIANMLSQKPIPKDIITYVQNSRCMGPETYSVCCGPPPGPAPVPNGQCVNTAAPPDPRTECCGHDGGSGNRIFGGNATKVDQYPWLALIEYTSKNKIQLLCGAALISGKYVLTAGHCVAGTVLNYGTPTNVRLGEYDINNSGPDCVTTEGNGEDCSAELVVVPIEKITVHPEYNPKVTASRHDIALIRLTEVVPYTDFVRPICLPTTDITISPPPSLYLYAAGWGATSDFTSSSNVKLHVELPYRSLQVCQPKYNSQRLRTQLWNGQLCAGGEIGKDTCKGDSGGPLMYENQNKIYEIIGIVSFGPTPCGMENVPGVYTKVYEYNLWIRSNIKP